MVTKETQSEKMRFARTHTLDSVLDPDEEDQLLEMLDLADSLVPRLNIGLLLAVAWRLRKMSPQGSAIQKLIRKSPEAREIFDELAKILWKMMKWNGYQAMAIVLGYYWLKQLFLNVKQDVHDQLSEVFSEPDELRQVLLVR